MFNPLSLFAPAALLLPFFGAGEIVPAANSDRDSVQFDPRHGSLKEEMGQVHLPLSLDAVYETPVQKQVRIEQRVIVRISPRPTAARQSLMAELPAQESAPAYLERKMEKCVPIANVMGVQTGSGNRLLLFLNDRRMVTASLEKSCRARDFYSGFYVERNDDGMLCVDRDKLQSRSGANCEVERMRELVRVTP